MKAVPVATSLTSLKIDGVTIGLVGLPQALAALSSREFFSDRERADFLLSEIAGNNYVPPGQEEAYRRALLERWRRDQGIAAAADEFLEIRVLGKECVSCNRLETMVREVLDRHGIQADLLKVSDPDEIGRYGVKGSPALIINGRICVAGIMPTSSQVEAWVRDAAAL